MEPITDTQFLTWGIIFLLTGFFTGFATRSSTVEREKDESYHLGFANGRNRGRADLQGKQ